MVRIDIVRFTVVKRLRCIFEACVSQYASTVHRGENVKTETSKRYVRRRRAFVSEVLFVFSKRLLDAVLRRPIRFAVPLYYRDAQPPSASPGFSLPFVFGIAQLRDAENALNRTCSPTGRSKLNATEWIA